MSNVRKIIHIDMDAFYASVEQRDNPAYRGKPVIVGGAPDARGVVAAASYEAREFGVHSAMSSSQASRLCPQGRFIKPRFEVYRKISGQIMQILHRYTDFVEPLSLDEAYLDVTSNKVGERYATEVAKSIKKEILDCTGLTASAGVAPNKFLAKIASDMNKPDGLTIVPPDSVSKFLKDLPVRKVPGIGKVTEKRMHALGVYTVAHLRERSKEELVQLYGKVGSWYYRIARGEDDRPVVVSRKRRSLSVETTFQCDLLDHFEMEEALLKLAERVEERLAKRELSGKTVTLKVTYSDFTKITRSRTLAHAVTEAKDLLETAVSLLLLTEAGERPIRLLGIGVSNLLNPAETESAGDSGPSQLELPYP